jgi:integrase
MRGKGDRISMIQKRKTKHRSTRAILRLPDLDHSKSSVLQSLGSAASKRTYGAAIEDFITWYCSEPRLAFGRTVVLRYRYELEARRLAPATINLRLAAVRRLTMKRPTTICSILTLLLASVVPKEQNALACVLAIGSPPIKEGSCWPYLLAIFLRDNRDYAILSLLLGCGLRRAELTGLTLGHLQQRDEHWAIVAKLICGQSGCGRREGMLVRNRFRFEFIVDCHLPLADSSRHCRPWQRTAKSCDQRLEELRD